jgi:hypothetical protein
MQEGCERWMGSCDLGGLDGVSTIFILPLHEVAYPGGDQMIPGPKLLKNYEKYSAFKHHLIVRFNANRVKENHPTTSPCGFH